ncbi:MAG TPA: serine hydrolase domain-containing protein [Gaiellaceae bacterium]|nr:serine hydrolase domain-containing protein [Gaiellaceae bacterium]
MNTPFQARCDELAVRHGIPALAAAMSVDGSVEVATAGCEPGTRFRIASITKPFTALLALSLLDLDEATGVWPSDVRVRHLLSHTSGFDCELPERDLARFGDGDEALASAVAELPAVDRLVGCDDIWSYANTGYWLLGHLCAVKAGVTFEEALERAVIAPFALSATSFGEPDVDGTGQGADEGPYPRARRPSGGLVSTVTDVLAFGTRLLTEPSFVRMAVPHGKPIGRVYGLGLFGERLGEVEAWGHSGSYGGFETSLLTIPARGAVFVGLTSSSNGQAALDELTDGFFERVVGRRRRVAPFIELPAEVMGAFAGSYACSDAQYEVVPAEGGLLVRVGGEELLVRPIAERTFRLVDGRDRMDFPRDGFARFGSRLARRVTRAG